MDSKGQRLHAVSELARSENERREVASVANLEEGPDKEHGFQAGTLVWYRAKMKSHSVVIVEAKEVTEEHLSLVMLGGESGRCVPSEG